MQLVPWRPPPDCGYSSIVVACSLMVISFPFQARFGCFIADSVHGCARWLPKIFRWDSLESLSLATCHLVSGGKGW